MRIRIGEYQGSSPRILQTWVNALSCEAVVCLATTNGVFIPLPAMLGYKYKANVVLRHQSTASTRLETNSAATRTSSILILSSALIIETSCSEIAFSCSNGIQQQLQLRYHAVREEGLFTQLDGHNELYRSLDQEGLQGSKEGFGVK